MSTDDSFQDVFSCLSPHSLESSYDNNTEPFPLMDETIMYSSSPNPFDPRDASRNWGSQALAMHRTESVLSYDSILSNDADIAISEYQDEVFSTTFDFGDGSPKLALPLATLCRRGGRAATAAAIKKGRKRKLSIAEREKTAHMRKIGACNACRERKLAVSNATFLFLLKLTSQVR
jgi:hypothetical protein